MQNIKKLAVFVLALCVTMPLFALKIKDHQPSRDAQAWLDGKVLNYLKQGQYQQIDKLVAPILACDKLKESYKQGETLPSECNDTSGKDKVYFVTIESATQPGVYKKDRAAIPTVNSEKAIYTALSKNFVWKNNAKYLDYNKFIAFYKKLSADSLLRVSASNFIGNKLKQNSPSKQPFDIMAIVTKLSPEGKLYWKAEMGVYDAECDRYWFFPETFDSWYGQAKNIYNNDMATFQQIKWKLFMYGIKNRMYCAQPYTTFDAFWSNVAIQPPFTPEMKKKKQEYVEKLIRKSYEHCVVEKHRNCSNIKVNAQKYGFWKETAAEREHRVNAEMRGHIATQPKM